MKHVFAFVFFLCTLPVFVSAQTIDSPKEKPVITGAERMEVYLPMLKGKAVALFANHTSQVNGVHLADTLLKRGIRIVKIFGPEHGFRGTAGAGEKVSNQTDSATGIPVLSLYGDRKKPKPEDLTDVDVIVFDIQDVGARFYTYISSLQYILEAALENHKPLMILDRPNPNGFYVDGPVLDKSFSSFVGMQPIPVVHGMTIGEYAMMLAGEKWLSQKANEIHAYNITTEPSVDTPFHMQVIKCKNYTHDTKYMLPVAPSPNLKDMGAIYLYPSTCLFEGTVISEGRGTDMPFRIFGHPDLPKHLYRFTPRANAGAKTGKLFNQTCYGWKIDGQADELLASLQHKINLSYIIEAYTLFPDKEKFFLPNLFFDKLAGNSLLRKQISEGLTEGEIRDSWKPGLLTFMNIRKKYLLYPDFTISKP